MPTTRVTSSLEFAIRCSALTISRQKPKGRHALTSTFWNVRIRRVIVKSTTNETIAFHWTPTIGNVGTSHLLRKPCKRRARTGVMQWLIPIIFLQQLSCVQSVTKFQQVLVARCAQCSGIGAALTRVSTMRTISHTSGICIRRDGLMWKNGHRTFCNRGLRLKTPFATQSVSLKSFGIVQIFPSLPTVPLHSHQRLQRPCIMVRHRPLLS